MIRVRVALINLQSAVELICQILICFKGSQYLLSLEDMTGHLMVFTHSLQSTWGWDKKLGFSGEPTELNIIISQSKSGAALQDNAKVYPYVSALNIYASDTQNLPRKCVFDWKNLEKAFVKE